MENIIIELNSKKYLLVEIPCTNSNKDETIKRLKKYECIYQGIKEFQKGGFFSGGFAIAKFLVPEENVIAFNKDQIER
jgi:hypothetical protein